MTIQKSSRHSKITGDFAENMILYWLSKSGFECAKVDHIGIDIIAFSSSSKERLGISVKCRSRLEGKEGEDIQMDNDHLNKMDGTCNNFNCIPFFAFVVDEAESIKIYILNKDYAVQEYLAKRKNGFAWNMTKKWLIEYDSDPEIKKLNIDYKMTDWWGAKKTNA